MFDRERRPEASTGNQGMEFGLETGNKDVIKLLSLTCSRLRKPGSGPWRINTQAGRRRALGDEVYRLSGKQPALGEGSGVPFPLAGIFFSSVVMW